MTDDLVTLYPTGTAHIQGDARVGSPPELVTEASPEAAAILLSYTPPAFTTEPTSFSTSLEESAHPHNTITSVAPLEASPPPPATPADQPKE